MVCSNFVVSKVVKRELKFNVKVDLSKRKNNAKKQIALVNKTNIFTTEFKQNK